MKTIALLLLSAAIVLAGIPCLTIDRQFVYAAGDLDQVYNVDIALDGTLTNWAFATNFIGNGTNTTPEIIDFLSLDTNKIYRVNLEL